MRLRALWRIIAQTIAWLLSLFAIGLPIGILYVIGMLIVGQSSRGALETSLESLRQSGVFNTLVGVITLFTTLFSVGIVGYFLDRRRFGDFGFHLNRRWILDLGFGLFLGVVLMAGVFVVEWQVGWIEPVVAFNAQPTYLLQIVSQLVLFLCVGIYEEISSRGYQLRNLAEGFNMPALGKRRATIVAWIVTSVWFGLLHAINPNTTPVSTFNIVLAGIFLGLGFVLTGELAIPIGLHITWNLFQGTVFGFPVSGATFGESLIALQQGGPEFWTGGAFGPEAGLIGILAMIAGSVLTMAWIRLSRGELALQTSLAEYSPRTSNELLSPTPGPLEP